MTRFFLSAAFGLALALPASAQQPQRPRENDEVAKLRAEVRELEARLKKESEKKDEGERKGEKKPEQKGEQKGEKKEGPKGPPMGSGAGSFGGFPGGPPMGEGFPGRGGGFGPMGGGGFGGGVGGSPGAGGPGGEGFGGRGGQLGGPDFSRMPGFDKLSKDEQQMLTNLVGKMRSSTSNRPAGGVEARLDRLEKAIEELKNSLRKSDQGVPRGPGGARGGDR